MLACAAASLSGCALPAATAGEVERDFADVLASTQELAGGTWENRDDPTARACSSPFGVAGQQRPALRIAVTPAAASPDDVAQAISELWVELGYTVTTVPPGKPAVSQVQARGSEGEYLIFRVSLEAMTLQGESACVTAP